MNIIFSFLSYAETLSRDIDGLGVFSLQYNATIANHSKILDDIDGIDSIKCWENEITLQLSSGFSVWSFATIFRNRTVIHGGPRWGCTDEKGEERPFYFEVKYTEVEAKNGTITVHGSHCSPFLLFKRLKWSMHVTPTTEKTRRSMIRNESLNDSKSSSTRGWIGPYHPSPISINRDLVQLANEAMETYGGSISGSAVASATLDISPVSIYWDIDIETSWYLIPYVYTSSLHIDVVPTLDMGIDVDLQSVSASVEFDIIPDFGVPYLGFAFKVGPVSFGLGLLMGVKGKIELEVATPIQYTAGVQISKNVQCGIDYYDTGDTSAYAEPMYWSGPTTVNAQNSWSKPDSLQGSLVFHIIPTMTLGLEGSFSTYSEAIKLMVSVCLQIEHLIIFGCPQLISFGSLRPTFTGHWISIMDNNCHR